MWPTGLIIGVAVAGSLIVLVAGVAIAVSIERRRYRLYLQRHTAGGPESLSRIADSLDDLSCCQPRKISLRRAALEESPETCVNLPLSNAIEQETSADSISLVSTPFQKEEYDVHESLGSPLGRKRRSGRCLKKKTRLNKNLSSTLSSISEQTSCTGVPRLSPSSTTTAISTLGSKDPEQVELFQVQVLPTSSQNQPSYRNAIETGNDNGQPVAVLGRGDKSRSANVGDPTLAKTNTLLYATRSWRQRGSGSDISVVSASAPSSTSSLPGISTQLNQTRECPTGIEKTQSQALQDFDFGLNSVMRLRSPAHVTHFGAQDSRAATTLCFRASVVPDLDQGQPSLVEIENPKLDRFELATERAASSLTGPTGRHSMFEETQSLLSERFGYGVSYRKDEDDPFIEGKLPRPASAACRTVLSVPQPIVSIQQPSILSYNALQRHEQANRTTTLKASPIPSYSVGLPKLRIPVFSSRTLQAMSRNPKTYAQPSWSQLSKEYSGQTNQQLFRFGSDVTRVSSPATPDLNKIHRWRFDPILPDTPRISLPSSPLQSHNSPILPSPVHRSSYLHPRFRSSQVRGPRNLSASRGASKNPISPSSKRSSHEHVNLVNSTGSGLKRDTASNQLRTSVKSAQNMNSNCELSTSATDVACYELQNSKSNVRPHNVPFRGDDRPTYESKSPSVLTQRTSNQLHKTLLQVPKENGEQRLSASNSVLSTGGTSVWDDASVHDDLSEPEIPSLTSIQNNATIIRDTTPSPSETPRTKMEDYEAYENFVQNYGKESIEWQDTSQGTAGLGIQFNCKVIPDTPRSMYDESGFLKE